MRVLNIMKDFIIRYKTYILLGIVGILSILSIVYQNYKEKSEIYINDNKMEINKYEDKIVVYITGEVKNPGVYYIDENFRLNDLVELCGGLTKNADLSEINLAEKLNDSDKIDIPAKSNEDNANIADIDNILENKNDNLVNINQASKDELKSLNGIGDTLANNIIEYRKNNKFESIEDILNVNGIGSSKYESIKEYICVD